MSDVTVALTQNTISVAVGNTVPYGVDSSAAFGTDNVAIRSDGTGRGVQSSKVVIADTGAVTTRQASTQDGIAVIGRAGGSGTYTATVTVATLSANTTLTIPALTGTVATLENAQTFTAAQTVSAADGVTIQQAATQDAVKIVGRAGGTGSYSATIAPPTLSGNVTITLPAASVDLGTGVFATSAFGTDNRMLRSDGTSRNAQASAITVDDSGNLSGAASVVIGTDPTGSELLRVGGDSVINGSVVISSTGATARASSLFIDQASAIKSRLFTLGSGTSTTGEIEILCFSSNASAGNSVLTLQASRIAANSACVLQLGNTTDATSPTDTSASLNTEGGLAVAKKIFNGDTTDASNKDTGSIVTEGGIAAEKSIFAGGDLQCSGVVKIDGTQVVKEQQAAIADESTADASDLATAIALANALKSKLNAALAMLRAHGLIAT
jgi:hypothetical protein